MSKKNKSIIVIIVIAIIAVLLIGYGVSKLIANHNIETAKSSKDIVVKDSDSKELKIKKIEKKIELINQEIDAVQSATKPELEKLNKLYEEYVSTMNESIVPSNSAE